AAARWRVAPDGCRTERGAVYHDGLSAKLAYEALVSDVASLDPPDDPPLKTADRFVYMGKRIPMLGAREKCNGAAKYGIDLTRPGMVQASIEGAPRVGATLQRYDDRAARRVPGVVDVVTLETPPATDLFPFVPSIAVVATSYWAALQGRRKLKTVWSDGPNAKVS